MFLQCFGGRKALVTQVALVAAAIPSIVGRPFMPFDLLVGDEPVRVSPPQSVVGRLTIEIGRLGTGTSLQMVRETTGCDESCQAERAADLVPAMGLRPQMLHGTII